MFELSRRKVRRSTDRSAGVLQSEILPGNLLHEYLCALHILSVPMYDLLFASLTISLLHATIPSHWLPVVAVGRQSGWSAWKTARITMLAGSAHALSTVLIGLILSLLGWKIGAGLASFTRYAAPALLIALGVVFIWRHYYHRHFHIHKKLQDGLSERQLIFTLALAMFLSPCLEIGGFFLLAGAQGLGAVLVLSGFYFVTTVLGMTVWVWLVWQGLRLSNWHALEHYAGIISGAVLVLTGLWMLVFGG